MSAKARFAFMTASPQVGAVIMILAIRLSKYVTMTAGCEGRRWVSTRTPLPAGKRKESILPTLNDQSFETSSAVTRSKRDCIGGRLSGSSGRFERERDDNR